MPAPRVEPLAAARPAFAGGNPARPCTCPHGPIGPHRYAHRSSRLDLLTGQAGQASAPPGALRWLDGLRAASHRANQQRVGPALGAAAVTSAAPQAPRPGGARGRRAGSRTRRPPQARPRAPRPPSVVPPLRSASTSCRPAVPVSACPGPPGVVPVGGPTPSRSANNVQPPAPVPAWPLPRPCPGSRHRRPSGRRPHPVFCGLARPVGPTCPGSRAAGRPPGVPPDKLSLYWGPGGPRPAGDPRLRWPQTLEVLP
jgi:hypothetical protein